ncbi:MAG: hypothetical protein B7Z40_19575 [Bosea sp. 12-68-7]|nr:MAG: hypothetical protein B7Z40_19575 [Bosea sp. 12-68-7]
MASDIQASKTIARVFISYSRKDVAFAQKLTAALTERGFEAYLDSKDIAPGEPWQERLGGLIRSADTVVFVISPDSIRSPVCGWEATEARSLEKRILPVVHRRVEDAAVPEALGRLNFIFMDDSASFDTQFALLVEAIETDLGWIRQHTRIADLAAAWAAHGRRPADLLRGQALEQVELWGATRPKNAPEPTELHRQFITESRRSATRRQRYAVIGALGVAAVSGALAFYANDQRIEAVAQRQQADQQRDTAQRNFRLARETLDGIIVQFAEGFKNTVGVRGDVLQRVLARARDALDRLANAAPDDPAVQRSRVVMLSEFGDMLRKAGDGPAALKTYQEGEAIARALIARFPDGPQVNLLLSSSLDRIGDMKLQAGDAPGALAAYEENLSISRKMAAQNQDTPSFQRGVTLSLDRVGYAKLQAGDSGGALKAFEETLAIRREFAARDVGNPEWLRDIAVSLDEIGGVRQRSGDVAATLKAYEEALAIRRELTKRDETNTNWQRDLSVSLKKLGAVRSRSNNVARALDDFEQSLKISRNLVRIDPANTDWQRDVALALLEIGEVRAGQNDTSRALAAFEDSLKILQGLSARDPTNTAWKWDVSLGFGRIADDDSIAIWRELTARNQANTIWQSGGSTNLMRLAFLKSRNDVPGAMATYQEVLAIRRALVQRDENNIEWWRDLALVLERVGDIQLRSNRAGDAVAAYLEGLDIRRAVAARDVSNAQWQQDICVNLGLLGDARLRNLDNAGAMLAYEEERDIRRLLAGRDAANPQRQRDLWQSHIKIGDTLSNRDAARALLSFDEAMRIARGLQARDAANTLWQRDVSVTLERQSDVWLKTGEKPAALKALEDALAIRRQLAARNATNNLFQTDLVISLFKTGSAGVQPRPRFAEALSILRKLDAVGNLSPAQKLWIGTIETAFNMEAARSGKRLRPCLPCSRFRAPLPECPPW